MSLRWFNRSRIAHWIGGILACLAFLAAVIDAFIKVRGGQGLVPYTSLIGLQVYPITALIAFAVVAGTAAVGKLLGWRSPARDHTKRR